MSGFVAIIDYGTGNLFSIAKRIELLGINAQITRSSKDVQCASKFILPGVGQFGNAMHKLRQSGIIDDLFNAVCRDKKPLLGICLGMQLLCNSSEEAPDTPGLGWVKGIVKKMSPSGDQRIKVPHIGWNQLNKRKESLLLQDVPATAEFYFTHSYYCILENSESIIAETEYGTSFTSVLQHENIYGVQFHPEKSHNAGLQVLKNFLSS